MRSLFVSAVVSVLALAACVPTDAGSQTHATAGTPYSGGQAQPHRCFSVQQVSNFTRGERDQVFLRVGRSDVYELSAAGGCPDMDFARQMALIPDGGTVGSRICTDDRVRIVVPGSTSRVSTCRVRVSRQLTEAEIAALPPRHRP